MDERTKPVEFRGSALDDLRAFPPEARSDAGFQLRRIQSGLEPLDWKPMNTIGNGVREIGISVDSGSFRVIYVAKPEDAIYVLHCFQKKTQQTSKAELALATRRYKELKL
jgi:phage-related protein